MKYTHIFNEHLIGKKIGERADTIRIMWADGRSFWHAQQFLRSADEIKSQEASNG